jgi:hypothetical protein
MTTPDEYRALAIRLLDESELVQRWAARAATPQQLQSLETIADGLRTVIYLLGYVAGDLTANAPAEQVQRGAWRVSDTWPCSFCNGLRFVYRGPDKAECERCGGTGVQPRGLQP